MPAEAFKLIFPDSYLTTEIAMAKTISKIKKRFAGLYQLEDKPIAITPNLLGKNT